MGTRVLCVHTYITCAHTCVPHNVTCTYAACAHTHAHHAGVTYKHVHRQDVSGVRGAVAAGLGTPTGGPSRAGGPSEASAPLRLRQDAR